MNILKLLTKHITVFGHIPEEKIIIASNHHSYIDAFIFGLLKKDIKPLAHQQVMDFPIKSFLNKHNFILATVDNGMEMLKNGYSLAICPSGLIEAAGEDFLPYRKGVIVIARDSETPILPIYISYSKYPGKWIKWLSVYHATLFLVLTVPFWRSHVIIRVGEPYLIPRDCDLENEAFILKEKVMSLARCSEDYINPIA